MDYPMTHLQRDLIETLRVEQNISPEVMDKLCRRFWERDTADLSIRQASALIDSLKRHKQQIHREIQMLAGQQLLFEVQP